MWLRLSSTMRNHSGSTHHLCGGNEQAAGQMAQAKFVYFRDTVSLQKALEEKIKAPIMDFGPDGAFAL